MRQRIAITGGAGFIGSHLARSHVASGDQVDIFIRPGSTPDPARVVSGVTVHAVPLGSYAELRRSLAGIEPHIIYHLATDAGRHQSASGSLEIAKLTADLTNLLNLISVAADLAVPPRVVIRAGSLAEYGDGALPFSETQRERPKAIYTTCAVAGAHYVSLLQPQLPFPVLHARFALTYGPNQSQEFLVPWLIDRCLRRVPSEIRCPDDRRDLIDVIDLVGGLRAMADRDLEGGTILNLATGQAPTIREVCSLVTAACGVDPALLSFHQAPQSDRRVHALQGATEKAEQMLGWRASIPLSKGLARLVSWHRHQRRAYA